MFFSTRNPNLDSHAYSMKNVLLCINYEAISNKQHKSETLYTVFYSTIW